MYIFLKDSKVTHLILASFILFFIVGCGEKVNPDKPLLNSYSQPKHGKTLLYMPISIDRVELVKKVNNVLPNQTIIPKTAKKVNKSLTYDYQVDKVGDIKVRAVADQLSLSIPIKAYINGVKTLCLGFWHKSKCRGSKTHTKGSTVVDANVVLDLALRVNPDYSIGVDINPEVALRNVPHLKFRLLGVKVSVDIRKEVNKVIKSKLPIFKAQLEQGINKELEKVKIKSKVQEGWEKFKAPVKISDAWVQFLPEKTLFRGFYVDKNKDALQMGLGVSGELRVSLTKPQALAMPMPPVETIKDFTPEFDTLLPLSSAFTDLENEANKKLKEKEFRSGDNFIKIDKISIEGTTLNNNSALLIGMKFTGGRDTNWYDIFLKHVSGTLYFTAVPAYDKEKKIVYIDQLQMTSQTSSMLLDLGLPWLAHYKFKELKEKFIYSIEKDLQRVKSKIDYALKVGRGTKIGVVKGELTELDFDGFYLDNNEIDLYLRAKGVVELKIK